MPSGRMCRWNRFSIGRSDSAVQSHGLMRTMRLLVLTCLWASPAFAEIPDLKVQSNVMVPMRDGVKLATDVFQPAGSTDRLPVILTRTPYGKGGAKKQGEYYARHGYVFVAQDTRGRYGSEGVWHI